jgi:hypothetical protein
MTFEVGGKTIMKKLLIVAATALGLSSIALATPCSITPPTNNLIAGAPNTISNPAADTNEPCTVLPLTFDNFSYNLNTGGFTTLLPTVSTIDASIAGSLVHFSFNPNLAAGSDLGLEFRVTGGVQGVALSFNGTGNGFVNEVVCSVFAPGGICPVGFVLATLNVTSGSQFASATFANQNTVWIFKDINSGSSPFSEIDQAFSTPEPMTFSLLGAGLLGLGLLRRKLKK